MERTIKQPALVEQELNIAQLLIGSKVDLNEEGLTTPGRFLGYREHDLHSGP